MASEQQQNAAGDQPAETAHNPASDTAALSAQGASRRRLATAGASGVLMTLASQGAMAALVCESPSGSLSGGLASRKPGSTSKCDGVSPGYWKNHKTSWKGLGVSWDTKFNSIFNSAGRPGYSTISCGDILSHQQFDTNNFGMHMMATYLNVVSKRVTFLSEAKLREIWKSWLTTGTYTPSKGATPWTSADIVLYLKSTMS